MSLQDDYIVAIGPNDYDRYFKCAQPLIVGSKCVVSNIYEGVGGFVANAASVMASLGAETYLFDCVGYDEYGDKIIDDLKRHNVKLDGIERGDYGNYLVDIFLSEGDRTCIIHDVKGRPQLSLNEAQRVLLDSCGYVYTCFSSLKKLPNYQDIVSILVEKDVAFFFDAERTTFASYEAEKFLFDSSRILSFNKNAYDHFIKTSGQVAFERLLADERRIILLTNGDKGTTILKDDEKLTCAPYKVESVDPSGAGDTFNGAFLYGYRKGWNLLKCGQFASIAAARAVTMLGSRSGCATEEEVIRFEEKYGKYQKMFK